MTIHKLIPLNPETELDSAATAAALCGALYDVGAGVYGTPPEAQETIAIPTTYAFGEGNFPAIIVATTEDAQTFVDTAANRVSNTELQAMIRGQL